MRSILKSLLLSFSETNWILVYSELPKHELVQHKFEYVRESNAVKLGTCNIKFQGIRTMSVHLVIFSVSHFFFETSCFWSRKASFLYNIDEESDPSGSSADGRHAIHFYPFSLRSISKRKSFNVDSTSAISRYRDIDAVLKIVLSWVQVAICIVIMHFNFSCIAAKWDTSS